MIDEKLISKWLREKTISEAQAKKMLADVKHTKQENRSSNLIVVVSTIGAILLGISAILFIASNWQELSRIAKLGILLGSTLAAYFAGYYFKFQNKTLPKVGSALLFLGALLFGATVILITQIYNLNANASSLVLIWLIGILPLVYALRSSAIAGLATVLFYLWIGLAMASNDWWFFEDLGRFSIVLFIITSILVFAIGGLHYLVPSFKDIARIYRIGSLKIFMVTLFIFTFDEFSSTSSRLMDWFHTTQSEIVLGIVLLSMLTVILSISNWFFNRSQQNSRYEGPISVVLVCLMLLFVFYPSSTSIWTLVFNLLFAGLIALLIYLGYTEEDMSLVNTGMFWFAVFVIARYFDWFWDLLGRSVFFFVGGVILLLGSIAMEKKRRQIKEKFGSDK